jgi:hypothetical protein
MAAALGAKFVTTVMFGALGAGVFVGVSHDGRGADPAGDDVLEEPPPLTTTAPPTTIVAPTALTVPSSAVEPTTAVGATTVLPAEPAVPDTTQARARVRSGGS